MIPIYSLEDAKKSILIRKSIVDTPVSPQINDQIIKIFGKTLTPQEVVKRIINDVVKKGDLALIEWSKKLDNTDISNSIEEQIPKLSRANIAQYAIENNGGIIIVTNIKEALSVINNFAPEHLSIITKDPQE
ncbi:unnamed protein product, partial [marine sediment metagenome]